jgi:hypothetical protein
VKTPFRLTTARFGAVRLSAVRLSAVRLSAVAVLAVTSIVGVAVLDAPVATADTSATTPQTAALVKATAAAATSKAATAKSARATYTAKSSAYSTAVTVMKARAATSAKAERVYVSKYKIAKTAQSNLKKVLKSKKSSAVKKHSTASAAKKAKVVKAAKAAFVKARNSATRAKTTAVAASRAYASAKAAVIAADKAAAAAAAAAKAALAKAAQEAAGLLQPAADLIAAAGNDPSMPEGSVLSNGRIWSQSYAEDFNTAAPLGKVLRTYPEMQAYDGFADTSGQGLYAPNKVLSVSNSNLDFFLHSENGRPLVASVMPDGYKPHTTGRISIRYKTDDIYGYKFVGMFWPSSDNWNDGEIDWPEADLGSKPRPASAIPGSMSGGNMQFRPSFETFAATDQSEYHIATTEWDKDAVRYYWDGKLVAAVTDAVPKKAMRVTLQAETFLGQGTVPKNTSGHLDIDWISIWD